MRIKKIIINNFKSFGPTDTIIEINKLSVFIGANSSGKTATMQALLKIFSPHNRDRFIERSDFHVPTGSNPLNYLDSSLSIEAIIEFNELDKDYHGSSVSIPPHFNHMVADETDGSPYVRIRLEASLSEGNTDRKSTRLNSSHVAISYAVFCLKKKKKKKTRNKK